MQNYGPDDRIVASTIFQLSELLHISKWQIAKFRLLYECLDPKKMERQKLKTVLYRCFGGLLVSLITYRGHFWHVCWRYHRTFLWDTVSALVQKITKYLEM